MSGDPPQVNGEGSTGERIHRVKIEYFLYTDHRCDDKEFESEAKGGKETGY